MHMVDADKLRKRYDDKTIKIKTEVGNEISLKELNFEKRIIGSDEAGNGEIFRPLITVATYVNPENIDKLIELNVKDSKDYGENYEKAKELFYPIAEKLTGFTSYKDFEGKEGIVIRTEYVTFVASALLNNKFNEDFKPGSGNKSGNLHDLIRNEHKVALRTLAGDVSYDYIVVDDFQRGLHHDKILDELREIDEIDKLARQTVIVEKADAKVMAVACASVIAYYLTNLYVDALNEMLGSKHGISISLPRGPKNKKIFQAPLKMMLDKFSKEEYEKFLTTYAKKYYMKDMELDD